MNTLSYASYNESQKDEKSKIEEFTINLGHSYQGNSDTIVKIGNWQGLYFYSIYILFELNIKICIYL